MKNYTVAILFVLVALLATVYSQSEMDNTTLALLALVAVFATVYALGGMGTGTGTPDGEAKTSWPELVGKTGEKAKAIIEGETKGVNVVILDEDAIATTDFRTDRVRVRVNKDGIVTQTPRIG